MQGRLGIPDDTPENTATSIGAILKEEADNLGAEFKRNKGLVRMTVELEIDIQKGGKVFRLKLSYIPSNDLQDVVTGSIGNGFLVADTEDWVLELLHGADVGPNWLGWNPGEPVPQRPFRWGLYPRSADYMHQGPSRILDGPLLRKLLRDSLGS